MDTFVDSSWYYARYPSFDCENAILDDRVNYWVPVDQYIGGIEHAILHLLYARFIHKCLRDLGFIKSNEPFSNLLTQGMVLAETFYRQDESGKKKWFNPADIKITKNEKGQIISAIYKADNEEVQVGGMEKMSKSKNNGVDPQALIKKYGADTARLFTMFAAPADISLEWSDHGVEGANRFIRRLWRFVFEHVQKGVVSKYRNGELTIEQKKLRRQLHQTIEKVTYDIEIRKQFNTAIASIMELINSYSKISFIEEASRQFAQELPAGHPW
jgi:leucyl-tRNA synthetase